MAFDLVVALKTKVTKVCVVLIPLMLSLVAFLVPPTTVRLEIDDSQNAILNSQEVQTSLTASISTESETSRIKVQNSDSIKDELGPNAVTSPIILRGNYFTATGRLEDTLTGLGVPDEPIKIFWNHFSWTEYETDRFNLESNYLIGQGQTDSNGDFSITTRDSDHSKATGVITVYSVFEGDPLLGPIEQNRNFTTDIVDCYATISMNLAVNTTIVREGRSFIADANLVFDNGTTPIVAAEGENTTFAWLGNITEVTIASYVASSTFLVPIGTAVGVFYPLEASFNVSILGLPHVVGDITSEADIGTVAADWANASRSIFVFTGAGIVFDIDEPVIPGPGQNPEVLRGETRITVSGILSDSDGLPFGYAISVDVKVSGIIIITDTTDNDGNFSIPFIIINSSLAVGVHGVSVNASAGEGINAIIETENITILGNSSMTTPTITGPPVVTPSLVLAMPNETVRILGIVRDVYGTNDPIPNMPISAQWEDYGLVYNTITSVSGSYTFDVQIPDTISPVERNGTVNIVTSSTQYYTVSSLSVNVDVFTNSFFNIWMNASTIVGGSTVTNLGGNTLYTNTNFTFQGLINDQFNRPLEDRIIEFIINGSVVDSDNLNASGGYSYNFNSISAGVIAANYNLTIALVDDPSMAFSYWVRFEDPPQPSITPTTPTNTTPNGDFNMNLAIGIFVTMVSLIVVVASVYAFGRFRRTKKMAADMVNDYMNLPAILNLIDESERAKDFRRAAILCYRAFEAICMQDLRILNARTQSPRELARIVASTNRIPVRDVTMLVMRYEEARFSDHKINKNSFTLAKQALDNVQLALRQEPKVG